ncbi:TetR/AcrR family transcriptional regulator [Pseudonocardia sp. GCM10023141]
MTSVRSDSQRRPVARADIERAAARVFRREGYRGSTMQHIADEVGLHKTSLYHHIQSKDSLLLAIAEFAMGEPLQELRTLSQDESLDEVQKLERAVYELVMMVTQRTDSVAVFTMYAQDIGDPDRARFFAQQRHEYGEIFEGLVADCLRVSGCDDDPRKVSTAILGMCNWMLHWYQPGHRETPVEMAEAFSRIALRMVGCVDGSDGQPATGTSAD